MSEEKTFNPSNYEGKWEQKWLTDKLYKTPELLNSEEKQKFYSLYSFPYPSGAGLHVGHVEGMVANDIAARYYRMKGRNVTLPMGWDSFGLPAENYAIKTGTPPEKSTEDAIKNFISQINHVGISVDWDKEVGAHRPDYYRWTQWIFLQLYKHGLAYKKTAPVNWCPKDQTVLANEQVINGVCERCGTEVVQRDMEQWFFKITDFADRLDKDLDKVDWPESTKIQQRNWIGKSEGSNIKFKVKGSKSESEVEIFTTRIDTIFGATFMVIAPEHPLLKNLRSEIKNQDEVDKYVKTASNLTDLERQTEKEKTGVKIEGLVAINPFNKEEIPIYVADYVVMTYGTGAIMAVPAHDERDGEFAFKYNIPIKSVVSDPAKKYIGLVTRDLSNNFDNFVSELNALSPEYKFKDENAVLFVIGESVVNKFVEIAKKNVKDGSWHDIVGPKYYYVTSKRTEVLDSFEDNSSILEEQKTMANSVKEFKTLWEMLYKSEFESHNYKEFVLFEDFGILKNSGEYSDKTSEEAIPQMQKWLKENNLGKKTTTYKIRDWLVSRQRYWGCPIPIVYDPEGKEHAVSEEDLPLVLPTDVDFQPHGESPIARSEEFKKRAEEKYGKGWHFEVDTMDTFVDSSWYFFRFTDAHNQKEFASSELMNYWLPTDLYMIGTEHTVLHLLYSRFFTKFFFDQGWINFDEPFYKMRHMGLILGPDGRKMSKRWGNVINPDDEVKKFGADAVRMYEMFIGPLEEAKPWNDRAENGVLRFLNRVWDLKSKVMEKVTTESQTSFEAQNREVNKLIKKVSEDIERLSFNTSVAKFMEFTNFLTKENSISKEVWQNFLLVLAPFAPFITEELWSQLGNDYSIHQQDWPEFDASVITDEVVKIAVQVNGKVRAVIEVEFDATEDDVKTVAMYDDKVKKYVTSEPKKVIFVKNKIINFIV